MSVGEKTTAIIDEDNHLYTWGFNNIQDKMGKSDFQDRSNGNEA